MKHNHHEEAARHYGQAALHQTEAHMCHLEGNDEKASQHAQIAKGHEVRADNHSREAARNLTEKNGTNK